MANQPTHLILRDLEAAGKYAVDTIAWFGVTPGGG